MIFFNLRIRGPLALFSHPLPSPIEMLRKEKSLWPSRQSLASFSLLGCHVFSLPLFNSIILSQALGAMSFTSAGIDSTKSLTVTEMNEYDNQVSYLIRTASHVSVSFGQMLMSGFSCFCFLFLCILMKTWLHQLVLSLGRNLERWVCGLRKAETNQPSWQYMFKNRYEPSSSQPILILFGHRLSQGILHPTQPAQHLSSFLACTEP